MRPGKTTPPQNDISVSKTLRATALAGRDKHSPRYPLPSSVWPPGSISQSSLTLREAFSGLPTKLNFNIPELSGISHSEAVCGKRAALNRIPFSIEQRTVCEAKNAKYSPFSQCIEQ